MSAQDLARAAYGAGFRGDSLITAIAVGLAESGGNAGASHRNSDANNQHGNTLDRGPWEINDYWHSEVSNSCAYDFDCSAQAVYRISDGGSNWGQWTTYTGGAYLNFIAQAQQAAESVLYVDGPSTYPPLTKGPMLPAPDLAQAAPVAAILLGLLALYEFAEVLG